MTATRGTSNSNERGSSEDRRRRREWLVNTWQADTHQIVLTEVKTGISRFTDGVGRTIYYFGDLDDVATLKAHTNPYEQAGYSVEVQKCCRCYRCGKLLTVDTVTVDRRTPGCKGGTYRRDNIRPACLSCNSSTGAKLSKRKTVSV